MRRNWLFHLPISASICGFFFPTQFSDAEIPAPRIKYSKYNKCLSKKRFVWFSQQSPQIADSWGAFWCWGHAPQMD
jgi:hypothetical protein